MNNNKNSDDQIITEKLLNLSASLFPKLYLFELALKNSLFNTINYELVRIKDFRNQLFHARIPLADSKDQDSFLNKYFQINQDLELLFKWIGVPQYHKIITTDNSLQIQEIKNLLHI